MRIAPPLALALLGACTFSPGQGWATLEEATFEAALRPGEARDLGDGAFLVLPGYTFTVEAATATFGPLELLELQGGGGGGGAFDPADPPEGYGLCHGGHCHADDGGLVSYAEIEAELAGGSAAFVPVVSLPLEGDFDLGAPAPRALDAGDPTAELDAADIGLIRVSIERLQIRGAFSGGPTDAELSAPVAVTIDLTTPGDLSAGVELPIGRGEDPRISLAASLEIDGTLLDGLDPATLAVDDALVIDDADAPGATLLLENLSLNALQVDITRARD